MNPSGLPAAAPAWRGLGAVLLASVALQSFGVSLWARQGETPIFEVLLYDRQWPEAWAAGIEAASVWVFLAAGSILLVAAPLAARGRLGRGLWIAPIAIATAAWQALLVLSAWLREENYRPGASWGWLEDWLGNWQVFGADATRFAAPLALLVWLPCRQTGPISAHRAGLLLWLLRAGAALTFAVHGYEAFRGNARFVDLLLAADHRLLAGTLSESGARQLLRPIGIVDLLLAGWILGRRSIFATGYMAVWGLITALSRTIHSGWDGAWETLIRAPNCGIPLAICLYWSLTRQSSPPARNRDPADGP